MGAFRKCVSGFPEKFVANREAGGARPELRSRKRVVGPEARELLVNLMIAGGGEKGGGERGVE